ncbi:MAG: TIGR00730 family Rossman fold protein [Phycisphaerales bacterium JB050]
MTLGKPASITVYCSSSASVDPAFLAVAREVGTILGESGRELVYGGGSQGLMGEVARSCRESGGRVVGIITQRLREAEIFDKANDENIVVNTMRERKRLLEERGDAFLILPGGLGTLEEFFEVLVGRLLGEHDKPLALVNPNDPMDAPLVQSNDSGDGRGGYWSPLLAMFDHMVHNRFMKPGVRKLFAVHNDPRAAIDVLDRMAVAGGHGMSDADLLPGVVHLDEEGGRD